MTDAQLPGARLKEWRAFELAPRTLSLTMAASFIPSCAWFQCLQILWIFGMQMSLSERSPRPVIWLQLSPYSCISTLKMYPQFCSFHAVQLESERFCCILFQHAYAKVQSDGSIWTRVQLAEGMKFSWTVTNSFLLAYFPRTHYVFFTATKKDHAQYILQVVVVLLLLVGLSSMPVLCRRSAACLAWRR